MILSRLLQTIFYYPIFNWSRVYVPSEEKTGLPFFRAAHLFLMLFHSLPVVEDIQSRDFFHLENEQIY
jgi:hypothetical protein